LFQSSYYYIGHFSRFIRPGAKRVLCATTDEIVEATAYVNVDGSVVTVVFNPGEEARDIRLDFGKSGTSVLLPARAIASFVPGV